MKSYSFGRFLTLFTNMFFGGLGYKVVFGQYSPAMSHDKKTVYLPRLPIGEVPEDTYKLFVGWAVHESCHRLTDPSVLDHLFQYTSKQHASLVKGLLNAIEDPRCEAVHLKTYPGSHSQLRGRLAVSVAQGCVRDGTKGPADALQMYCCHWGRVAMLGHIEVAEHLETARAELVKHLGDEGFSRIEALVAKAMPELESSWDAYDLSLCLLDELNQMAKGNDSDAQAILDDEKVDPATDTDELAQALEQALEQEIERQMSATGVTDPSSVLNHPDVNVGSEQAKEDLDQFRKTKAETGMVAASFKQRLVALLAAQKRPHKVSSRRGRLSVKNITRAATGNPYVYERKVGEEKPVAALTILVDMSGSMTDFNRQSLAQLALVALSEAVNAVGFPLEVLGFGSDNGTTAGLVEIKPYGKSYHQCQARLGGYTAMSNGFTPMGEAMLEAGNRLLQQNSPRKVMMVLTDGEPNFGSPVRSASEMLLRQGVEVIGIGIQSDAVKHYFSKYSVVNNLEDLGREVLSVVTNTLLAA